MVTNTQRQALPVPDAADDPNIPADLLALANAIEKKLVGTYATASARDAANATGGPVDGQFAYITGTDTFYVYNGSAWVQFPAAIPSFTSGTGVPSNASGANGDVYFRY